MTLVTTSRVASLLAPHPRLSLLTPHPRLSLLALAHLLRQVEPQLYVVHRPGTPQDAAEEDAACDKKGVCVHDVRTGAPFPRLSLLTPPPLVFSSSLLQTQTHVLSPIASNHRKQDGKPAQKVLQYENSLSSDISPWSIVVPVRGCPRIKTGCSSSSVSSMAEENCKDSTARRPRCVSGKVSSLRAQLLPLLSSPKPRALLKAARRVTTITLGQ